MDKELRIAQLVSLSNAKSRQHCQSTQPLPMNKLPDGIGIKSKLRSRRVLNTVRSGFEERRGSSPSL